MSERDGEKNEQSGAGAPRLHVVAGPNGAGKSTLTRRLSQRGDLLGDAPVVNPDVIARGVRPEQPEEAAFEAGRKALRRTASFLREQHRFAIETTTSGKRGLRSIQQPSSATLKCV